MKGNKIDLNTASAEELETIEGIDGERASALIEPRDELGGFSGWDDVDSTPGFDGIMMSKLHAAATAGEETEQAGKGEGQRGRAGTRSLNEASEEELTDIQQIDGTRARMIMTTVPSTAGKTSRRSTGSPNIVKQLAVGEHLARVPCKQREQLVLDRREVHELGFDGHFVACVIDPDRTNDGHRIFRCGSPACVS